MPGWRAAAGLAKHGSVERIGLEWAVRVGSYCSSWGIIMFNVSDLDLMSHNPR